VQFGGVTVSRFTVVSPYEIKVTPPAYSRSTQCAPNLPDQTPLTDVCQSQVRVENAHGTSAEAKIVPPLEGTIPLLYLVYSGLPPGCQCEIHAAPTEFDYTPTPKITSISTSPADPSSLASEQGGTVITVTGRGLDFQTTWGPLFGDPSLYSSGYNDPIFETGTEMQLIVPPEPLSTEPESVPFYVESLAGFSAPGPSVTYAGIPAVSRALNTATGRDGAPDTGGTPIVVSGNGLAQATGPLQFTDSQSSYSTTTQSSYTINSDTSISSQTVQQDPALVDVEVCSVTGCSSNPPADYLALYPPGDPKVDSITPTSGTAAGGTPVTIGGENLSCVTGVYFGGVPAEQITTAQALANCGQTNLIDATAPPGHAGTTIPVTVATVESDYTGSGPSKSSASFTYTP
jgi:hypothetical protein